MNLLLDYDVVNAIKDINENFSPLKIIRNETGNVLKISLPIVFFGNWILLGDGFTAFQPKNLVILFTTFLSLHLGVKAIFGDIYKMKAERRISVLPSQFSSINVLTSSELLKESKCYKRIYNFKLNEKKIPQLIESKYILVPTYGLDGEIVDESILQEHVVGTKKYVLSKSSPSKVLKPVLSNV